ncbi:beta-N-acetylhexosaminidase [Photobacterium angustum]|uniref:beta-N-acetylhexosaminidase n=1 Tax=Photobacterium angustum TaxID=661 RepID=UPI0009BC3FD6|nr:glycoside hydrolase family 20 protein [Photobacterium angustum]PSW96960.1 hypothetical protein C0W79_01545 [Photobacterium angustum]PSX00593.1 hypothetical protein C0W87_17635 [Photobacterium angustum]PSX32795.1 hypothetical protein C0W38_18300 [Photobacterium angustum]
MHLRKKILSLSLFMSLGIYTNPLLAADISSSSLTNNKCNKIESPKVIPSFSTWQCHKGVFKLTHKSNIVVDAKYAKKLLSTSEVLQKDILDLFSKSLNVVISEKPNKGDIFLTISKQETSLSNEGYQLDIADHLTIKALHDNGVLWGTRSLLQLLQLDPAHSHIQHASVTDNPKWEHRGLLLDVGRMYLPTYFLKNMIKQLSYFKMNELQLHLNDNVIKIDEDNWLNAESGFRLESTSHPDITSQQHYTKKEYIELIQFAQSYGVKIISEIDAPAHSLAFTQAYPSLRLKGEGVSPDHLDLANPESIQLLEDLWQEYAPIFTDVHIGTDEYRHGNPEDIKSFVNHFDKFLHKLGKKEVRMWGSQASYGGAKGVKRDLLVDLWYPGYYDPKQAIDDGYDIINSQDDILYMVPFAGYYQDYLNTRWLYNHWTPNVFTGKDVAHFDVNNPHIKGGMISVWNDAFAAGTYYEPSDIQDRVEPALKTVSQKLWAAKATTTYAEFKDMMEELHPAI